MAVCAYAWMDTVNLLEGLFDRKILKVLKLFLQNKDKQYYLREISKQLRIPVATVFRIVRRLLELDVIREVKIKKFKLYECQENKNTAFLESFIKEGKRIIEAFVDKVKELSAVEAIIQYGEETEDKANLIIIGAGVDSNTLKPYTAEIKEKYRYTISVLPLTREQFEQISSMGLYSGKKEVLYNKSTPPELQPP